MLILERAIMQSKLDITELYQYGERVSFKKGENLAQSVSGETSGDIYILSSGICALFIYFLRWQRNYLPLF